MRDVSKKNLLILLFIGLILNILSYYLIETNNNGVRISCYVFSVFFWIAMIPNLLYNWSVLRKINQSKATDL